MSLSWEKQDCWTAEWVDFRIAKKINLMLLTPDRNAFHVALNTCWNMENS